MYAIYKITNLVNNKLYIGKARHVKHRWYKHLSAARTKKLNDYFYLHRAINKYGGHNFIIETIAMCENEEGALSAETFYIKLYNTQNRDIGYNLTSGGDGASGYKCSEETKAKISKANKGRKHSIETRKRMGDAHRGSKRTEETKKKMRISRAKQAPMTDEIRNKISEAHKGKILTEEHKTKISKNNKSKILTEENVLNIIQLINNNKPLVEIGKQFNISEGTVSGIKSGTKWKRFFYLVKVPNRKKIILPPYDELLKMVQESNYSQVGRLLGVSNVTVKNYLKKPKPQ